MAYVNVLLAGGEGSGKTTFLKTIAEVVVLSTDNAIIRTDPKAPAVRYSEFGRVKIDEDITMSVYAPSPNALESMREALASNMLGAVILVDRSVEEGFDDAQRLLKTFKTKPKTPLVIALNRHNAPDPAAEIAGARKRLRLDESVPIILVSALDRGSLRNALLALLFTALESADTAAAV